MKNHFAAFSITALTSVAPFALAASSAELTVTGFITPSVCTPDLSEDGIVFYDKIPAKDLSQDSYNNLETRTLTLTVKCNAAARLALLSIDNRADSSDSPVTFGLGKINGTQNLGQYMLNMYAAIADGVSVSTVKSEDGETGWRYHMIWQPGEYVSVSAQGDTRYEPISVQELTFALDVLPAIKPARGLDLSNEVSIDGSATIEMKYL